MPLMMSSWLNHQTCKRHFRSAGVQDANVFSGSHRHKINLISFSLFTFTFKTLPNSVESGQCWEATCGSGNELSPHFFCQSPCFLAFLMAVLGWVCEEPGSVEWPSRPFQWRLHSLKLTASLPLKIGWAPKGNDRIPTIHFQVRTASFREGNTTVFAAQHQEENEDSFTRVHCGWK